MRCSIDRRFPGAVAWLVVLIPAGCAFSPGDPWGRLEASLEVDMVPSPGRQDASGRLVTALDYRVRIDSIKVQGGELEVLGMSGGGGEATTAFDPAHPPEGYTLCHGGHCHTTDGRLVPYEEITGASTGASEQTWQRIPWQQGSVEVPVWGRGTVPLGPCPEDCALPEGSLTRVQVTLDGVALEGQVFDARTGESRRLPEEGVPFRGIVTGSVEVRTVLSEEVGPGHPLRVPLAVTLSIPESLLDGVDFASLPQDGEFRDLAGAGSSIREALAAGLTVQGEVVR